jgi:sec-independent protein translocase protein TatC
MGDDSEPRGSKADDADASAAAPSESASDDPDGGDDSSTERPASTGPESESELEPEMDSPAEADESPSTADESTADDIEWTTFAAGERDADGTPKPTPPVGAVDDAGADAPGTESADEASDDPLGDDGEIAVDADAGNGDDVGGFEFGTPTVDDPDADDADTTEQDDSKADDVDTPVPDEDRDDADATEPDDADATEPDEVDDPGADDIDAPMPDEEHDDGVDAESADGDPEVFFGDVVTDEEEITGAETSDAADTTDTADSEADTGVTAASPSASASAATADRPADPRDAASAATATDGVYDPAADDEDDLFDGPESDVEMPLADHIEEMVRRLAIVLVIAGIVGVFVFPVADDLVNFLWNTHIPGATTIESRRPRLYGPLELILTELKVASLAGFVVGLPVFVYQTYRFMRPGLYPKERKYYLAAVPTSLILAFVGVAFAHFVVLPAIFAYFTSYTIGTAVIAFGLKETFGLILVLMGYMALVFQIPLFIMLAIMMNLVTRQWLTEKRLLFWGSFLGLSFIVSPDPTGMAPIIVAATMIVLFEGTLLLLRWVKR